MRARISLTLQEQIAPRKCNVEGRVTTCSRHEAHGIECAEEQRLLAQAESQVSHNEPACEYRHVKEATRHDGRGGVRQTPAGGATHCICGAMAPRMIQFVNGWADSSVYMVRGDGPPPGTFPWPGMRGCVCVVSLVLRCGVSTASFAQRTRADAGSLRARRMAECVAAAPRCGGLARACVHRRFGSATCNLGTRGTLVLCGTRDPRAGEAPAPAAGAWRRRGAGNECALRGELGYGPFYGTSHRVYWGFRSRSTA